MNSKYEIVKNYYDKGLWSEYRVEMAAKKGWITEEEKILILTHSE